MKTARALLFCFLLSAASVSAQQVPTATSKDLNSTSAARIVKKSKSKAKTPKSHNVADVQKDGMPPALSEHLRKLAQAIPGNGGESPNGPGGAAEEAFQRRAYPDSDIPAERFVNARAAHGKIRERNFRQDGQGSWQSFGPSDAIYPFTPLRNFTSYVPNEYAAASRITTLAISSKCGPGRCTLWASPAGGGIWRTRNALDQNPRWEYLSGVFEINSVGSIAVDPNDPDG